MIIFILLLQYWTWMFNPPDPIPSSMYEVGDGYLVQEVFLDSHPQHHAQFAGLSLLLSEYGEFRIVSSLDWLKALRSDSISFDHSILIVEVSPNVSVMDSSGIRHSLSVNYSVGLTRILQLDDTELFRIGDKLYAARQIRYAYLDGLALAYFKPDDDSWVDITSLQPRLFLFALAVSSSSLEVERHVWKRKYEIPHFWQGYMKRGLQRTN